MSRRGRLSYPIPLAGWLIPIMAVALSTRAALSAVMLLVIATSYLLLRYYSEPVRAWLESRDEWRGRRPLEA